MKKWLVLAAMMNLVSIASFAETVCPPKTLPKYLCKPLASSDPIYEAVRFDLTVCVGKNKVEVASVDAKTKQRESIPARVEKSESAITYTMLDDDGSDLMELKINLLDMKKSSFRYAGDHTQQSRDCKTVK